MKVRHIIAAIAGTVLVAMAAAAWRAMRAAQEENQS